jgi:gliding motility-associated-like protein
MTINQAPGFTTVTAAFAGDVTYRSSSDTHAFTITGLAARRSADLELPSSPQDETVNCTIMIPNGFSPNGDGINDYFQITCIDKYPDAKLLIYSGTGALLYEQQHYGNLDFWGSEDAAWWNGSDKNKNQLPAASYIYILDLDHGRKDLIKTGVVFISK